MENVESYSWHVTTSNVDHPLIPAPPPTKCVDQEVLSMVLSPRIFKVCITIASGVGTTFPSSSTSHYFDRLMAEFFYMEVTLSPYPHFTRVLKLLTSHKCPYSHPVQICDSNHTLRHGSWPMTTCTDQKESFSARNGGQKIVF